MNIPQNDFHSLHPGFCWQLINIKNNESKIENFCNTPVQCMLSDLLITNVLGSYSSRFVTYFSKVIYVLSNLQQPVSINYYTLPISS